MRSRPGELHPVLLSQPKLVRLPLELHRTHIAVRRVSTFWIVEALDVIEHVGLLWSRYRYTVSAVGLAVQNLDLI